MVLASFPPSPYFLLSFPHNLHESNYVECQSAMGALNYNPVSEFSSKSFIRMGREFILWDPHWITYLESRAFSNHL